MSIADPSDLLSKPTTKAGRTQRVVLGLLDEKHEAGDIPTNVRFVFYELEQRGLATKPTPDDHRRNRRRSIGWPPGEQDVTDAITYLRDRGIIPWSWFVDEERTLTVWDYAGSVTEYLCKQVPFARINPWGEKEPPLLTCESKATAGVLRDTAWEYLCPITGTKGQSKGFLITEVAPILTDNERPVLYLGDLDFSGGKIEANTRRVLERAAGREIEWTRLGMTEEQARDYKIDPIWKVDGRTRGGKGHWAVEVESLGQSAVVALVRAALDALLPEPLADIRAEEERQQDEAHARLGGAE